MARNKNQDADGIKTVCRNKRALHDYEIHDTLECGVVLKGTEVKSLRESSASLDGAYAKIEDGELWLIGSDIPEYSMGNKLNHKPKRPRQRSMGYFRAVLASLAATQSLRSRPRALLRART